ncbi:hypothetical protein J5N97_001420 [Dioscorea zingiberensis]|uniref:Uncharacterized protein n=1 Tax=Dioscorea zingiberensis TaxID=325984 RepID=A0A9D5H2A1_9LILI|nr:hypothetical protein J5N97_001420 [Dioscorea zingiberensis]
MKTYQAQSPFEAEMEVVREGLKQLIKLPKSFVTIYTHNRIRLIYCESDEYHGSGQRRRTEVYTQNPNAPLFIPAAFQQVEDFSPQWWDLVKTATWFLDHWSSQHQDEETFGVDDEDDIAKSAA